MLSSLRTALIADIYDLIVVDFLLQSTHEQNQSVFPTQGPVIQMYEEIAERLPHTVIGLPGGVPVSHVLQLIHNT